MTSDTEAWIEDEHGNKTAFDLDTLKNRADIRLFQILQPPEMRNTIPKEGELEQVLTHVMGWLSSDPSSRDFSDKLGRKIDFEQIGILNHRGDLNEARTQLISDYIWARREEKPSYLKLLRWLRDEIDAGKRRQEQAQLSADKTKQAKARQKAKAARKKGRKARRK